MSFPRIVITGTAGLVAVAVAAGALSADKPTIKAPLALPERRPMPAALAPALRLARLKAAVKSAGFATLAEKIANLPPITRLTPIAPAHSSGAAITYAGPGVLLGAAAGEPDGAFLLQASAVKMSFPTSASKVYVLTCRLEMMANAPPITVKRAGANPVGIPVDNGHILHAFQATGASTALSLEALPPGNFPVAGYFYGCDLSAAN